MTPETYTKLLKDLQKIQKKLVTEYVATVRGSDALQARMDERHRASETGGRLDDFVVIAARRSAVQLLLRTVYVRVLEDLGALRPVRIRGDWGLAAFREVAPALRVRSYLTWTFRDLAVDFPALFTPGRDELPLPSEDLCQTLWELWHRDDGRGHLVYDWQNGDEKGEGGFDSRFLGDLYQDLDKEVRKRYALLQTPEFVESYILDHTLTPALDEFDPADLRDRGETFRLIDPTCGSGHFLIGAFHRLADYWEGKGLESWDAAERALESVWGCDINPHAVDIARFRLLLEVRSRTGVVDLERLAGLGLNLLAMDSLVPWERLNEGQKEMFPGHDRLASYGNEEERTRNAAFMARDFHTAVGNPPYIVPKDSQKRKDYAAFWPDSCHMNYALAAPFVERFFALGMRGAGIGIINANSFMKRQFGSKLIEQVLPAWEITGVVDTSGAYIPGHGTPTLILFGRCTPSEGKNVWAVLGKRGEPRRPLVPAQGHVWRAIEEAGLEPDDSNAFITVAHVPRSRFNRHPWSLSGGRSGEVGQSIVRSSAAILEQRLGKRIGFQCISGEDAVYINASDVYRREGVPGRFVYTAVEGDQIRDYHISRGQCLFLPLKSPNEGVADYTDLGRARQMLWRAKAVLRRRIVSGSTRSYERRHSEGTCSSSRTTPFPEPLIYASAEVGLGVTALGSGVRPR